MSTIAHGLFHLVKHLTKEYGPQITKYIKEHQRTNGKTSLQIPYPNFIWVSEEQRKADAAKFASVKRVDELLSKGEAIPESLYRMAPAEIYEFLKQSDKLDLIPKHLETLHLKTKS